MVINDGDWWSAMAILGKVMIKHWVTALLDKHIYDFTLEVPQVGAGQNLSLL